MPHLVNLYNTYPDSVLQIIGINTQDSQNRVIKEADKLDLPYPNMIGRGTSVAKDFKITILPYLYIIDKEGTIEHGEIFVMFDMMKDIVDDLNGTTKK